MSRTRKLAIAGAMIAGLATVGLAGFSVLAAAPAITNQHAAANTAANARANSGSDKQTGDDGQDEGQPAKQETRAPGHR